MFYCDKGDKIFATCQSLWKHRQQKDAEQKKDIIGKTINIADTRGGFDSKSTTTNILPKEIKFLQIKIPGSRRKMLSTKVIKPKSLTKTAMAIESDESDAKEN